MSTTTQPTTTVTKRCPMCQTTTSQQVPTEVLAARAVGVLIQDAWPQGSRAQREFVQTGYCPQCMTMLFGFTEDQPISNREQAITRGRAAAATLASDHEKSATVHTFMAVIEDTGYSDHDAWDCVTGLEDLASRQNQDPRHG